MSASASTTSADAQPLAARFVGRGVLLWKPRWQRREASCRDCHRSPRVRHDAARRLADGGPRRSRSTTSLPLRLRLDELGVGYIEGGWPGANPKDRAFFQRAAAGDLTLRNAVLAAFGATRKPGVVAADDPQVRALLDAQTPVVTLVAKSHTGHVERALRTTLAENLAMVRDTVDLPVRGGAAGVPRRRALLRRLPARPRLRARGGAATAAESGAEVVALCDTNGGMLPGQLADVVDELVVADYAGERRADRDPRARRHLVRGGQLARRRTSRRDATCREPPTVTASGPATPTCSRSSPVSSSSSIVPVSPGGLARRARPGQSCHR